MDDGDKEFEVFVERCVSEDGRFNIGPAAMPSSMRLSFVNRNVPSPLITLIVPTTVPNNGSRVTVLACDIFFGSSMSVDGITVSSWPSPLRRSFDSEKNREHKAANSLNSSTLPDEGIIAGHGDYGFQWDGPDRILFVMSGINATTNRYRRLVIRTLDGGQTPSGSDFASTLATSRLVGLTEGEAIKTDTELVSSIDHLLNCFVLFSNDCPFEHAIGEGPDCMPCPTPGAQCPGAP